MRAISVNRIDMARSRSGENQQLAGSTASVASALPAWRRQLQIIVLAGLAGIYSYCVVRTAWLTDDAYISFRSISNFLAGHGLTQNVGERVQAFTHPLWVLLLSSVVYFTGEFYYTTLAVSMVLSLASVVIYITGIARSFGQAVLGLVIVLFSKAFVDFSTSGLENALTYLLMSILLWVYLADRAMTARRLFLLSLVGSLCVLNRMDTLLLVMPVLVQTWWQHLTGLQRRAGVIALGFTPVIAWEIVAVIYYGFPFPNTAYAKLNTGIPYVEMIGQGLRYLQNSLARDPLTLIAIVAALAAAGIQKQGKQLAVAMGVALYLAYVIWIGGDFMSGRFLAGPLLMAVIVLGTVRLPRQGGARLWLAAMVAAGAIGLLSPHPSLLSTAQYGTGSEQAIDRFGIADERGYYYPSTGLFRIVQLKRSLPDHYCVEEAAEIRQRQQRVAINADTLGMLGFYAGPATYVTDVYALADPLLARLPMEAGPCWRIGHFKRWVPDGYKESLESGENRLSDVRLRPLYDKLRLVIRGPLFTWERWKAIAAFTLGRYDDLVDQDFYRFPPVRRRAYEVAIPRQTGTPLDVSGLVALPDNGVIISLPGRKGLSRLEMSLDSRHEHRIVYIHSDGSTTTQVLPAAPGAADALTLYTAEVPASVQQRGFDRVWLLPSQRGDRCRLGHIGPADSAVPSRAPVQGDIKK